VVEWSGAPVSAKIRAGWDKPAVESVRDIARVIEDAGVSMITVHARTKAQGFDGRADWLLIKAVKETVSIPVVGNGDVTDGPSYLRMRETTGCDAVMIGRSAIGNPWIFGEIKAAIDGREYAPPSLRDRVTGLVSHIRSSVRHDGEPFGVIATRRVMSAYLKHVPNARSVRAAMMTSTRLVEIEEVLETFLARIDPRTSH
jgi:tRNA-dihydrouridine synthase